MNNRYRVYIFAQLLVVVGVIGAFRLISEKQWASLVAIGFFLLGSVGIIISELRGGRWQKSLSFYSTAVFLVFFVGPIIYLRVTSWDRVFELESIFGVTGGQLHKASNTAFMLMVGSYFLQSILNKKSPHK